MKKIPDAYRWLLSIGAPTLICLIGWGQVINQNHQLQSKTIRAHQTAQLKTLKILSQVIGRQIIQTRLHQPANQTIDVERTVVQPMLQGLSQADQQAQFHALLVQPKMAIAPPHF
ncbi:hypothetical protein IQ266_26390, partial [filamentous cyanobacterium LEGE 11480]